MNPKLAVITIHAENVPETAAFYRDIIGLELLKHHSPDRVNLKMGDDLYLVIVKGKPPIPSIRFPVIAFRVDNLDSAFDELHSKGVDIPDGIEEDTVSRWIFINDPGGNLVEIAEFDVTPFEQ